MINKNKKKFALIAHPPDISIFRNYMKFLKPDKNYKDKLILKLFEWAPAYKVQEWHNFTLDNINFADGIMVMIPFLPEMKEIKLKEVIKKIEEGLKIANEEGCSVAALGAFTSIVLQGQEEKYSNKYEINLTSGNTFTAAVIINSIERLVEKYGSSIKDKTITIIGASGDIGTGCMVYFGSKVKKLNFAARGVIVLEEVIKKYKKNITCEYEIFDNNFKAIKGADIVILATSAYSSIFHINDFQPGTLICDASAPSNVEYNAKLRDDVLLYKGGIVKLPIPLDPGFDIGLSTTDNMYGCMTEGILHSLYNDLPLSFGRGNITKQKIDFFSPHLNNKLGLKPSYAIGSYQYTEKDLKNFKTFFNKKR